MILYKYLNEDKARKWLIRRNGVLLTPPKFLNDESEFRVRRIAADDEELRRMFEDFGGISQIDRYKETVLAPSFCKGEPDYMKAKLSEYFGIVSLSEKPLDAAMWERYANNSGVAIGYPAIEETTRNDLTARFFEWGPIWRVDYDSSEERDLIAKDFSNVTRNVTLKGVKWEYEAEWRFIGKLKDATKHPEGSDVFYTVPAHRSKIRRVIFGHSASFEFKRDFCLWLGNALPLIDEIVIAENSELRTRPFLPLREQ